MTHGREENGGGWGELDMLIKNPSSKMANKIMAMSLKNDYIYSMLQSSSQAINSTFNLCIIFEN